MFSEQKVMFMWDLGLELRLSDFRSPWPLASFDMPERNLLNSPLDRMKLFLNTFSGIFSNFRKETEMVR